MILYLKHNKIDKKRWDKCVAKNSLHLPYAYSWVLDILHPNWNALINKNYEIVMPLPYKTKMGFKILTQSPWLQQLGIFSSVEENNYVLQQEIYNAFFNKIPTYYFKQYFRLNSSNTAFNQLSKYTISHRNNQVLELNDTYEHLRKNFSKNTKRNINKAEKNDLKLDKNIALSELLNLYKTFIFPKQKFITESDFKDLKLLLTEISNRNRGFIWGVRNNKNNLLCANFFWQEKSRIISLLPSSSNKGKENLAMFFLLNELIKSFAQKAFVLDFEGSSVENIARFNKSWGATNEIFLEMNYFLGLK